MPKFMLILHDNPAELMDISAADMQAVIERYSAWAQGLAERGQHLGGHKLSDDGGRWLTREDGELCAVDGPYTEAKEVIGGYFLIEASDLAEAESIAAQCPHLDFGGRVELRQVDDIPEAD